ncbi:MAG: sigma-54-dependent Fis family transcriptional regulator [Rhodospirillales bacterium]|nr:sigma-54-dependent Fis family transcriptional regulator [Rhodospirillales bacterium]
MAHDILIVDDEADIRALTSGILQDEGFQTREAGDSKVALGSIETRQPSLVLLDIWLQGSELDGLDILKIIARDHPYVPVVIMSGHGTVESAVLAIKDGAYDFIEKPFAADRLVLAVERAIEAMRLRRENEELRIRAGTETELVGRSAAINQVRQTIERVAPTNSRVLITGPAGSGKEVVARMLHSRSRRADAPFVVVNCANMDPNRVETELFGTEGSSEDTETARKTGMFEAAHNGTLLLDSVDDMPLETQGKIVRVLQEQTFERVGGRTRVEVDVRVVAATSSNLADRMNAGDFREDLFYRLSVVPIGVPSLRDRRDDIPLLAPHFMKRAAEAGGQSSRDFGEDAIAALQAYDWPGNVRELRNVVEWLLIMAPDGTGEPIHADMLPAAVVSQTPVRASGDGNSEIMSLPLREAREIFEREYLVAQINRFGGNISKTAEFVGMERSALHRKLKLLGVTDENSRRG